MDGLPWVAPPRMEPPPSPLSSRRYTERRCQGQRNAWSCVEQLCRAIGLETWLHGSPSANHFQWKVTFHQPSMRPCLAAMIMFANITPMRDARVPIQQDGLALAATG